MLPQYRDRRGAYVASSAINRRTLASLHNRLPCLTPCLLHKQFPLPITDMLTTVDIWGGKALSVLQRLRRDSDVLLRWLRETCGERREPVRVSVEKADPFVVIVKCSLRG